MLSGFFAHEWGNDLFQRPDLFESFCLAAREHDNGWCEWELAPEIDPKTRVPYTFMSVPTEEHVALYQRGLDRLAKVDRYAALLASLHCTGLYDRARATIPGYSAKYVKSTESQLVNEFLQRLKLQQLRLKVDLRTNPATKVPGRRQIAGTERGSTGGFGSPFALFLPQFLGRGHDRQRSPARRTRNR